LLEQNQPPCGGGGEDLSGFPQGVKKRDAEKGSDLLEIPAEKAGTGDSIPHTIPSNFQKLSLSGGFFSGIFPGHRCHYFK